MSEDTQVETDPERLALLYDRFKDVCLVEKEVWKEIYMPRQVTKGAVLTNVQENMMSSSMMKRSKMRWKPISPLVGSH